MKKRRDILNRKINRYLRRKQLLKEEDGKVAFPIEESIIRECLM